MNLRPLGYEPNELPDCSTPRQMRTRIYLLTRQPSTPRKKRVVGRCGERAEGAWEMSRGAEAASVSERPTPPGPRR